MKSDLAPQIIAPWQEGRSAGLSICMNDGDKGQEGQRDWEGWYPHAIVFGKRRRLVYWYFPEANRHLLKLKTNCQPPEATSSNKMPP